MSEQELVSSSRPASQIEPQLAINRDGVFTEDDDLGEEDVPTVVLYVIAGLLLLSFTLYLIIGGGHSHFH